GESAVFIHGLSAAASLSAATATRAPPITPSAPSAPSALDTPMTPDMPNVADVHDAPNATIDHAIMTSRAVLLRMLPSFACRRPVRAVRYSARLSPRGTKFDRSFRNVSISGDLLRKWPRWRLTPLVSTKLRGG